MRTSLAQHMEQHTVYTIIFLCSRETTVRTYTVATAKQTECTDLALNGTLSYEGRKECGMFETHQSSLLRKPSWSHAGDLDHVMMKVSPSVRILSKTKDTKKRRSVSIHVKHRHKP